MLVNIYDIKIIQYYQVKLEFKRKTSEVSSNLSAINKGTKYVLLFFYNHCIIMINVGDLNNV